MKWNIPYLQIYSYLKKINFPLIRGSILGSISYIFTIVIVKMVSFLIVNPNQFSASYDGIVLEENEIFSIKKGRIGFQIFLCGIYFVYRSSQLYIPFYQDEKIILKQQKEQQEKTQFEKMELKKEKKQKKNLLKFHKVDEPEEKMSSNDEEESCTNNQEFNVEDDPMNSPNYILNLKRKMFYLVLLFSSIFLTFMFFISLTEIYNSNIILFIVIYLFIEMLIIWFLKNYLLQELLLVAPILSAFELIQVISLHSQNLDYYYQLNVYRLLMISLFRIIIDPFINSLRIYKQKLGRYLEKKAEIDEKYVKYLKYFKSNSHYDTKAFENYTGDNYEIREEVPKEIILISLLSFTTKACMNSIRSLLMFVYYFLNTEINLGVYNQEKSELLKYIAASFFISLIQVFVDVLALYSIELIHDFHIFDYINFCRFRYLRRKTDWLMDSVNFDVSIGIEYRSLDFLGFSDQFYFLVSFLALNMSLISIGVVIMVESNYNFFNDPSNFLYIVIIFPLLELLYRIFGSLSRLLKIWKRKQQQPQRSFFMTLKLDNYMTQEIDIYQEEFIVEDFIKKKKEFLIGNLHKIVTKADFLSQNGFLLRIYKLLDDSVRKEQINVMKREIVEKNEFKKSSIQLLEENGIIISSKKGFVRLLTMLHFWYSLGKETLFFRRLIADIPLKYLEKICGTCSSDENLFAVEQIDFYQILKEYREHFKGLISFGNQWIKFYEKRQNFKTLCKECKLIEEIKKFKQEVKKKEYIKKKIKDAKLEGLHEQPIFKEITREEIRPNCLRFILLWYSTAKSNLLHVPQTNNNFTFSNLKNIIDE